MRRIERFGPCWNPFGIPHLHRHYSKSALVREVGMDVGSIWNLGDTVAFRYPHIDTIPSICRNIVEMS